MLRSTKLLFVVLPLFVGCVEIKLEGFPTRPVETRESIEAELLRGQLSRELAAAKNPESKKAPFDPENPADRRETVNWVRSVWKEYYDVKAQGNPVQQAAALEQVREQLEQMRERVRWPFTVSYLGNDGQRDFMDVAASDCLPTEYQFKTARMSQPGNVARFYMGDDITEEAYHNLKRNAPVTLEVTIAGDMIHHFIVLDDCTFVESE